MKVFFDIDNTQYYKGEKREKILTLVFKEYKKILRANNKIRTKYI